MINFPCSGIGFHGVIKNSYSVSSPTLITPDGFEILIDWNDELIKLVPVAVDVVPSSIILPAFVIVLTVYKPLKGLIFPGFVAFYIEKLITDPLGQPELQAFVISKSFKLFVS
jgi:hypothetical protein